MDRRVVLPLVLLVSACIHVYQSIRPRPLDPHTPVTVTTPVKVHLVDGSTVVFLAGLTVDSAEVRGDGNRYSLTLRDSAAVTSIPLDSIVGMEAFEQSVNGASSFVVSVLATGGTLLAVTGLAVAIFGSCPKSSAPVQPSTRTAPAPRCCRRRDSLTASRRYSRAGTSIGSVSSKLPMGRCASRFATKRSRRTT